MAVLDAALQKLVSARAVDGGPRRSPAATLLLPKFIARRRQDVATIRDALARGDVEVIVRIGHNLRGNGLSFGFPEIGPIGERLEAAAEASDRERVLAELEALEAWLARIDEHAPPSNTAR
jgi:HPt (histidine-containing phosphotransfer) domain-containing protein